MFSRNETLRTLHEKGLLENEKAYLTGILSNLSKCLCDIEMSLELAADNTRVCISTNSLAPGEAPRYLIDYRDEEGNLRIYDAYIGNHEPYTYRGPSSSNRMANWSGNSLTRSEVENLLEEVCKGSQDPISPGEIIREEFLKPRGLGNPLLLEQIITLAEYNEPISQQTAELLAEAFGTSIEFWLNLQNNYESEINKLRSK